MKKSNSMKTKFSAGGETRTQIDRLVDGAVPDHELAALLESLDREPAGWKQCAMTFLEQQYLQRELQQLVGFDEVGLPQPLSTDVTPRASLAGQSVPDTTHANTSMSDSAQGSDIALANHSERRWWQNPSTRVALATAACLVIAVGIGFYVDGLLYPRRDQGSGSQDPLVAAEGADELPLRVVDNRSGQMRTVSVPVRGASDQDELFGEIENGRDVYTFNNRPYRVERETVPVQSRGKLYKLPIEKHQVVDFGKRYQ